MPRKARVEIPGTVYYFICRDSKTDLFSSSPGSNPAEEYTYFMTGSKDIAVATTTAGANMRYTINGAPPTSTSGTLITSSSGTVRLTPSPMGTVLRVIAFKAGMNDSAVNSGTYYYDPDNGTGANDSGINSGNMPNPGDGGPGGGGVVIDGGDQPTINYDDNGNLIHYKEWNYRYDAQNRLIEVWNGTTTAQFYYDGKNRQIARNINGVVRFSSWDGWELLEEYGSGLSVAKGYLQGATGVIKSWDPIYGQLYYYQDKLGSTTHVANGGGQLLESYKYDLYGTPSYFSSTSQPPQPLNQSAYNVADLYAGERWIPELRLYDLRNRFMSSELGRFLQVDPIGFKGDGSNLYRYCGNDPVDRSDPTGLVASPVDILKPNLIITGQGDWMQAGSPFTNGELLSKVQNYLGELKSSIDRYVNMANAESRNVKWSADYSNWLKSSKDFKNSQDIATTDLSTKSEAVMNTKGTVASFNVNLHIDINWNADQSRSFGSALRTDTFGLGKTGEIEHARDALKALTSSYGGSRPARAIANEQAANMVGQSISHAEASSRMDAALVDWTRRTRDQSREDRDASWQHRY